LGQTDRNAIVLRFFEEKSLAEIGQTLGLSEDAARKRVSRALEKLRARFAARGIVTTSALLLASLSTNAIQAAPVGLAAAVTSSAIAKGAVLTTSTSTLVKGTMKIMTWIKLKTAAAASLALIVGSVATIVVSQNAPEKSPERAGGVANPEPDWAGALKAANSDQERQQIEKIWCLDNLKQVGWAARQWSFAHKGVFPSDFLSLKNDLYTPKCLTCPSDVNRVGVTNWSRIKAADISYLLVSPGLRDTRPNVVVAKCPIHGHVVVSSAQAFQGEYLKQKGMTIKAGNVLE